MSEAQKVVDDFLNRIQTLTIARNKYDPVKAAAHNYKWRLKNPEKFKTSQKNWKANNRDKTRAHQAAWRGAQPSGGKRQWLRRSHLHTESLYY